MSDYSQGEGWWQASDGKWYPPAPAAQPPPAPTQPLGPAPMGPAPAPAKSGLGTGPVVAIVVAAVAIIGAVIFFATSGDSNKKNASETTSSSSSESSTSSSSRSSSSKSSSSSGAPAVTAPAGFKVFSNDKDRFALAIPENLDVVDLSTGDIDRLVQQFSDANPALAKLGPQIKSIFSRGGKLFAIQPAAEASGGFSDNLNVIASPGTVDVTSAAVKSQAEQQLTSIGATNVTFETLTVHRRKVLASSYEATVNSPDGTAVSLFGRQAVVSAGGKVWFITFSTSADGGDAFKTIVQTFDVNG